MERHSRHTRSHHLAFGDLRIEGRSRAGEETWLRVHPPGLALDAGRGPLVLSGAADLFISHGHLDHALGVPFLLSQRTLHRSAPTRVFCPEATAAPLTALIEAAARLEGSDYRHQVRPLAPGQRVELGKGLLIEAFATDHGVPSLGAHLVRRRRRLAAPYQGLSPRELVARKARGETIEEEREELWLSYCGDTGPGAFELEPRLFETRVLVIECTFLAPEHRERARRFQHVHFEDLVERADRFRNQAIVLHHLSRRHRLAELRQAVDERLPTLAPRVHLLGAAGVAE